jgi:hypothetical protein
MDYAAILTTIAETHEQDNVDAWVETAAIREAVEYIRKLERALELYERERIRFRHAHPEMTGAYFISGESGNKDNNLLPEHIWICPAYGCDWSQRYVRTDNTSGPEW